jgi:inosine-uridine nucleoside N-ribohydrolase
MSIPVILDTDIGSDIDDTWALAMLLKCPELDVKLVTSATGDTEHRARIIARLLEVAGRTDVPVGVGIRGPGGPGPQAPWVDGYELGRYPGTIHHDAVAAIVSTIMDAPRPPTLIAIGPATNIGAALQREPGIARRARFVGMYGDLRGGYRGNPDPLAEYNVKSDVPACQRVFTAPWEMAITPLDTCGRVRLTGAKYQAVCDCPDPLTCAMVENYRVWAATIQWEDRWGPRPQAQTESTILFDTVAVYMAFSTELLGMETLGVRVADDGHTVIDETAKPIRCATKWRNLAAFEDLLVQRLTSSCSR